RDDRYSAFIHADRNPILGLDPPPPPHFERQRDLALRADAALILLHGDHASAVQLQVLVVPRVYRKWCGRDATTPCERERAAMRSAVSPEREARGARRTARARGPGRAGSASAARVWRPGGRTPPPAGATPAAAGAPPRSGATGRRCRYPTPAAPAG